MIIGVLSDTHSDRANALPHIMAEFKNRGVEQIIHCGDIEPKHLNPDLFLNLPVVCALNDEQLPKINFQKPPLNWTFTTPGKRVLDIGHTRFYVGHKRSIEIVAGSEIQFSQTIDRLRQDFDGLRWMLSGHTHHQIFFQSRLVNFVNPGAIEDSFDGYEFAIIDTKTDEIIFSRIPRTKPIDNPFSVGIISDSLNISRLDPTFWQKLAKELKARDVSHIIHCGNIANADIGLKEFCDFTIHYYLRNGQQNSSTVPDNWHLINKEKPIVDILGYQFYIQLDLARILLENSEIEMHKLSLKIKEQYPFVSFLLYGCTNDAFLEEGQQTRIINPGDVAKGRTFCVICLPKTEITFGHVPVDPLPQI